MRLQGAMTALVTPMRDGTLDEPALRAMVARQLEAGIDGLVPCGTTGEAATLTSDEWARVIQIVVEVVAGRVPVLAGTGDRGTAQTIAASRAAERLGADGILVVTPFYNKPTQEGMYQHFRAVADSVSIPICLYNVPGRTGVHLEPATIERLLVAPNIIAVKEATGNMAVATDIRRRCGDRIALLSGDDFSALGLIAHGGQGTISVASNLVPAHISTLIHAALKGALAPAADMNARLYPLFKALFVESNPIPVKTGAAMMGLCAEELRLPLCSMGEAGRAVLTQAMEDLELLRRST